MREINLYITKMSYRNIKKFKNFQKQGQKFQKIGPKIPKIGPKVQKMKGFFFLATSIYIYILNIFFINDYIYN